MSRGWARAAALLLAGASAGLLAGGLLQDRLPSDAGLAAEVRRLRSENEALRRTLSWRRLAAGRSEPDALHSDAGGDKAPGKADESEAASPAGRELQLPANATSSVDLYAPEKRTAQPQVALMDDAAMDVAEGLDPNKAFQLADRNHDGMVEPKELQKDLAGFDIQVTEAEAKQIVTYLATRAVVFNSQRVFQMMDMNKDGGLGVDELRSGAKHFGVQVTDLQSHALVHYLAHHAKQDPTMLGGYTYAVATTNGGKHQPDLAVTSAMSKALQPRQPKDAGHKHSMESTVAGQATRYQALVLLVLLLACAFEYAHRAWAEVDLSKPMEQELGVDAEELDQQTSLSALGTWSLLKLYWCSPESWRGWVLLLLVTLFQAASIWIQAELVNLTSSYWDAIGDKDWAAFWALMKAALPFILLAVVQSAYFNYVWYMLEIKWRTAMTVQLQGLWLKNKAFYKMRLLEGSGLAASLDNPDQRIESDVVEFVKSALNLFFGILNAAGQLFVFLPMLWVLSPEHCLGVEGFAVPGWLCWVSMFYALFGTVTQHAVGRRLMTVNYMKQQTGADFRAGLLRVREGAEAIALFEAEGCELKRLASLFGRTQRIFWESMRVCLRTDMFNSGYFYLSDLFPLLMLSPSYFAGHITLGGLQKARTAQGTVLGSFSWFMGAYADLMSFRSTSFRLQEFFSVATSTSAEGFGAADGKAGPSFACSLTQGAAADGVSFAGTVSLPTGRTLHQGVSLTVPPGQWAMLEGPSGCGKTTLLRALTGLWPFGSGRVERPKDAAMVPAESTARLLRGATLREVVSYPRPAGHFEDSEIEAALRAVDLEVLLDAPSGGAGAECGPLKTPSTLRDEVTSLVPGAKALDRTDDWELALSSGQRQRLEFAFLLCARPQLVILDEPTAHLPTDHAVRLLRTLKRQLPASTTLLTVSHDPELAKCHDMQFAVGHDGIQASKTV